METTVEIIRRIARSITLFRLDPQPPNISPIRAMGRPTRKAKSRGKTPFGARFCLLGIERTPVFPASPALLITFSYKASGNMICKTENIKKFHPFNLNKPFDYGVRFP